MVLTRRTEYTGLLVRRAQQAHAALWLAEVSTETTSVQFGVLDALLLDPGLSQRELGDRLDLDRSTIADIVLRLERRRLLSRDRHESDRRRNVLRLTELGRAETAHLLPLVERMDGLLTADLGPEELTAFRRSLLRVADPEAAGNGSEAARDSAGQNSTGVGLRR
ncbi:MarR family winged helix-turn-helix transcriptional regulator [Frondihabitans cladoniiphilus]|uniref:Winged helix DNA-binding protein n=1 Tax=Frondihabitans cladoniiphilus TaxID=715785 RepID=A0ABP8WCB3_9MICO